MFWTLLIKHVSHSGRTNVLENWNEALTLPTLESCGLLIQSTDTHLELNIYSIVLLKSFTKKMLFAILTLIYHQLSTWCCDFKSSHPIQSHPTEICMLSIFISYFKSKSRLSEIWKLHFKQTNTLIDANIVYLEGTLTPFSAGSLTVHGRFLKNSFVYNFQWKVLQITTEEDF